ncbi:hypothetical protein BJV77DRAFT_169476 [Russula vinacea]|nr:hypothetical protein BJV77DRAFT_169476 [Russula vinacea]
MSTVAYDSDVGNAPVPSTHSTTTNLLHPTRATINHRPTLATPISRPPRQMTDHPICYEWLFQGCFNPACEFLHPLPQQSHAYDTVGLLGPQTAGSYNTPAAQTNTMRPVIQDPRSIASQLMLHHGPVESDPAIIAVFRPFPTCPPPLEKKPTSAIHPAHANASSLQVCLPSSLQEQSPLPKSTPPDEISLRVMESTRVKFSGGFSIEKIVTGFESSWFVIEDVPSTVGRAAIEELVAPFGEVQEVRIPRRSDNPTSLAISVQMATYREALQAINRLDGRDAFECRLSVHLSLGKRLERRMLNDNYVCVSWPIPRKAGYAGYSTLEAAQSAVSKADGKTEGDYWITASMYQSIPIIDAYNVRFTGLPPGVDQKFLDRFGPSGGTMLERPNYQAPEFGIPAVRRTLASFGKITHFKVVRPPYKDGFVRLWCQFESPDVARAACELHQVKQRALGMEKIRVRRVLSVLERVPRAKFNLVEQDLHRLQENLWNHVPGAHLDILPPREGETAVRLVAKDSQTLARLRVELKDIVDGEIVKENGQQVWDDFLRREAGLRFVEHLRECNPYVMISVHWFRRCVRLIGTVERRQPVVAAILAKLASLRQDKVHTIQLDGQAMGVVASPELAAAQQRHGEENIRVDFQKHVLLVRGPDDLYEEVQQIVHVVKSRHVANFTNDHCPVCLDPPLTPVSLSCGHTWCKTCLVAYLTAAADTRSFPISCLGNQGRCTELIPMRMVREVLPPADFDALALAAFHAYVQAHPGEFTTVQHQTVHKFTPPVLGMLHYPAHPASHASVRRATSSTTRASPARTAKTEGTGCSRSGCGFTTSRNAQVAMHPLSVLRGVTT